MTGTTTDIRPGVSEKNLIVCLNGPDVSDVPISNFKVQPSRAGTTIGNSSSEIHPQLLCEPSSLNGFHPKFKTRSSRSRTLAFSTAPTSRCVGSISNRCPAKYGQTRPIEPVRHRTKPIRADPSNNAMAATWMTKRSMPDRRTPLTEHDAVASCEVVSSELSIILSFHHFCLLVAGSVPHLRDYIPASRRLKIPTAIARQTMPAIKYHTQAPNQLRSKCGSGSP